MRLIILAILMTLYFAHVYGQNKNDTIKIIDLKIQTINKDTNYSTVSFANEEFLDQKFINQHNQGYGNLIGYFKNGNLCKIHLLFGFKLLEKTAITEYYFSEGKLIFVFEKEKLGPEIFTESDGTYEDRRVEPKYEAQYYFCNDKLIYSFQSGMRETFLIPDPGIFNSMSKEELLLFSAKKCYKLLSDKYKQ